MRTARRWPSRELRILKENFHRGREHVQTRLPHRSPGAIRQKARELGLVPTRRQWHGSKLKKLRQLYETASFAELQAAFPGEEPSFLHGMAKYCGLKRPKHTFQPTGVPVLDQIRDKSQNKGISMSGLDRMARSSRYFEKASWLSGHLNYDAIAGAVHALGGELYVEWED